MIDLTDLNIRVIAFGETLAAHWDTKEARFHVWLDTDNNYKPFNVIYKNALVEYRQPGYFDTRKLDATKKANAALISEIMGVIRDGDMINKAKAEHAAIQASANAKHEQLMQRRRRARELFRMFADLTEPGGYKPPCTLSPADMEALLSFAPKHGEEDFG